MGDLNCTMPWGYFSAQDGDDITVEIRSTKWFTDTVIEASEVQIFNTEP